MARKLRLQFPGAIYHLMNRGDRREDIFRDDEDRERFIDTLAEACTKTSWQVHAFCLMRNHFHLVVETPEANLVAGMKWMLGTYTVRFNRRHALTGHLFSGRYRSQLVGGVGGYLRTACDYVHLNPVRAGMVSAGMKVRGYRWSSVQSYLAVPGVRPVWLRVDRLFGECGIQEDSDAGRREFESRLERQRSMDQGEEFEQVRGNWCFGDDKFRQELLAHVNATTGDYHYGKEFHEAAEDKAGRIVTEELARLGWTEVDLRMQRKGAPEKVAMARRLRQETTMTLEWIAERLIMGTRGHLTHLLYWENRQRPRPASIPKHKSPATERIARAIAIAKGDSAQIGIVTLPMTDPIVGQFDTSFD